MFTMGVKLLLSVYNKHSVVTFMFIGVWRIEGDVRCTALPQLLGMFLTKKKTLNQFVVVK